MMKKYFAPDACIYSLCPDSYVMLNTSLHPDENAGGDDAMSHDRLASDAIWKEE